MLDWVDLELVLRLGNSDIYFTRLGNSWHYLKFVFLFLEKNVFEKILLTWIESKNILKYEDFSDKMRWESPWPER